MNGHPVIGLWCIDYHQYIHLVGKLPAEDLEEVADVPGGAVHVVVDLALPDGRGLAVHDDLLDDEPHARKALRSPIQ